MGGGARWATPHGAAKSQTRLSDKDAHTSSLGASDSSSVGWGRPEMVLSPELCLCVSAHWSLSGGSPTTCPFTTRAILGAALQLGEGTVASVSVPHPHPHWTILGKLQAAFGGRKELRFATHCLCSPGRPCSHRASGAFVTHPSVCKLRSLAAWSFSELTAHYNQMGAFENNKK